MKAEVLKIPNFVINKSIICTRKVLNKIGLLVYLDVELTIAKHKYRTFCKSYICIGPFKDSIMLNQKIIYTYHINLL